MFKNIVGNVASLKAGSLVNLHGSLICKVESVEKVEPHHRLVKMVDNAGRNISATFHEKDNVKIV